MKGNRFINNIPFVTKSQMQKIDKIMVDELGIDIELMIENAAINTAQLARLMLGGDVVGKKVVVFCGKGYNGGDGLAAVRHLTNWGAKCIIVLCSSRGELKEASRKQCGICEKMDIPIYCFPEEKVNFKKTDLIIDALLGYSLIGNPRPPFAQLIRMANTSGIQILAIDIPSGLDADTGIAFNPTIKASTTLTLAVPKIGFVKEKAKEFIGKLYVADISVPEIVYKMIGIKYSPIFKRQSIVPILIKSRA